MGSLLAVLALGLFSANVFVVRSASVRLDQQVGVLVALMANVVFGGLLFAADLARRIALDMGAFGRSRWPGCLPATWGDGVSSARWRPSGRRARAVQIANPMFAAVLIGEVLDSVEVVLIALVLGGLYLTTLAPQEDRTAVAPSVRPWTARPTAALWPALFSASAYAAGNVLRAHALDAWWEPVLGGLVGALAGTLMYALLHVRVRDLRRAEPLPASGVLLWTLAGILTISAEISVIGATGYLPIAIVLVISSSLPLVVVPVSLLVLRNVEALSATTLVGTGLVLLGVSGILLR